jgi:Ca2+-binding RTX toxin-like protein
MTLSSSLVQLDGTGANISVLGTHSFTLTGTSGNDTIHDYTNIASTATNTIHGGDGSDIIVAHNNTLGAELIYGDGGNDTLIGGGGAQVYGGDGADVLLALGGAANLSGGAGNDVLLNAYASTDTTAKAVTMSGGAGNDTFALIGTNNSSVVGNMKTIVADLGTGDAIDLSFLEKTGANADQSITSTADLSGGKASMTTAGTTLNLTSFVATTSEAGKNDVNSGATGGTMIISNATLTKTAAAITAGMGTESAIDFNSTFGHLTDTYNNH